MVLRTWIILFIVPLCFPVSAQTMAHPDTAVYYMNYAATGFINRATDGNSYLVNNAMKFSISRRNTEGNLTGGWIYGRQQSGLTNNDFSAIADVNFLKGIKKIYYWGLLTYDKSYSLKIDNRVQAGAGIGYIVWNKPAVNLVLSDGPLYEATRLYDTSLYQTIRKELRIVW